jgi:hypothetical protein
MHITVIETKDGRKFVGFLRMWRPWENWLSIVDPDLDGGKETRVSFDDIVSAVTRNERIDIHKTGDEDELERARQDLAVGRKLNWEGYPKEKYKWEDGL